MASSDLIVGTVRSLDAASPQVKLCTFCSNSTNGYDKWLYVSEQTKSPFFPILGQIRGEQTIYDDAGKALVCIACFHHLLRQWSSFDRRRIPLQKREYSLIAEEKLSNFQLRREEEIRREAELKLKEIKLREEIIRKEAHEKLELYRKREQQIREEAENRLLQEGEELEKIREEAGRQLKEEKEQEERLKKALEDDIRLEREKGEYIRREAERLLREEKLLSSSSPTPSARTELVIKSGRAYDRLDNNSDPEHDINMNPSRSKKMEYDPDTGCYRRIVPLDFEDEKVEDIVQKEMKKSVVTMTLQTDKPAWKKSEEKERGSKPDSSLEDLTLNSNTSEGDAMPHYLSGDAIQTEYQFTVKEESTVESSPPEKNGEFEDEEIKKAGEAIKAKFDGDRKKFEREPEDVTMSETTKRSYERRRRSDDDPEKKKPREDTKERSMSLEKKIKDMEERRARMLRRSSGDRGDGDDTVKITRTISTESSSGNHDDDTGSSLADARARRARIREERNKRRLASEALDAKPTKSAGVVLELRGSGSGFGSKDESSSDFYPGQDSGSDITFTEKKKAEKKDDSGEDKNTTYTKTTKNISLSGSLLDEPNEWSRSSKTDDTDDITFSVKRSSRKETDDKPSRERIQEDEVKIDHSEPVQSRYSGLDLMQDEPDDIVYTVKKPTSTTTVKSTDEPLMSISKEITLESRPLDPKNDLISWDDDADDSGSKTNFTETEPKEKSPVEDKSEPKPKRRSRVFDTEENKRDDEPKPKPRERVIRSMDEKKDDSPKPKRRERVGESTNEKRDSEPKPKPRERVTDSSEYKGSLSRAELSWNQEARKKPDSDSVDGYQGSLGRNDVNRAGSFNRGRNDLPPVILHDIENDLHEEQPVLEPHRPIVELKREIPVESIPSDTSSIEEVAAPVPIPRYQDKPTDDERRNRELEIEEKRRQIMEKQKRASVKRRGKPESAQSDEPSIPQSNDDVEDLKEKRRSLLMMWEAYTDGEGPGPENKTDEDPRRMSFGYDKMMMEAAETDPNALKVTGIAGTMDIEDDNEDQRVPLVEIDERHKMNDDELRWERAGQFQPGRLNSKFHEVDQDDANADNIVFETKKTRPALNNNNVDETMTNYRVEQSYSYQAPEQDISFTETTEVESSPKRGLWDENEDQSTHKDDDDEGDDRKPIAEIDERNRLTEDEARWDRAGQFQPGKINKSIFEGRGSPDQNERGGSQKFKKSESSRYDQIKKIQRTDSKKELLVPKKVALKASANQDVIEQIEDERPEIGKIDKSSLRYETMTNEERQRREKEERTRREMEEIEREREEDRRRREREDREVTTTINTFEDDEFDVKVKSKNVNKIDISKFGGFQKSSEPEQKPVPRVSKRISSERIQTNRIETVESTEEDIFEQQVRKRSVGKLNIASSPFKQHDKPTSNAQDLKTENIVPHVTTLDESAPSNDFENQDYDSRVRSVKKLDKNRFPFSSDETPNKDDFKSPKMNVTRQTTPVSDDRKAKREQEKREWDKGLQLEREQIEHVKKAHDNTFYSASEEGGYDSNINNTDNETRNVKKLDISLFSKFKQEKPRQQAPVRKSSVKKDEKTVYSNEVVTVSKVTEVESAPAPLTEDEEYELKRRSVGKLNKGWLSQMHEQGNKEAEQRLKETEKERINQEQYEINKLKNEEMKRRQYEPEDAFGNEGNDVTDKPQNVKRLDNSVMSPFLKGGKSPDSASKKKTKDEIREERKLARRESRSKINTDEVVYAQETIEVQESPEETTFDGPPKNVGRLDKGRYLQMMGDDSSEKEKRKRQLEEERVRRELEEMERLREDEERRNREDFHYEVSNSTVTDKPQNVNKINLSHFSQFQQKDTVVEVTRKTSAKKSPEAQKEKQRVPDQDVIETSVVTEVHSAPYSYEDAEIVIEEKPKSVGKLDFNKITKSFAEEAEEKQRRLVELERERIRRENEEREFLLREQQREDDNIIVESSVQEVHSAPTRFEDEQAAEQSPKKSVGKLDFNKITQSFTHEAEEHRGRLVEMEKERVRKEEAERKLMLREKERQREAESANKRTNVQEVPSEPADVTEDQLYEEKRKSVGKLDFGKITKSFGEEAEEKRQRLIEVERERIRREKEERDLLLLEEERIRSHEVDNDDVGSKQKTTTTNVGKLDFEKITKSFGNEAEEKRQRLVELEKERLRREKEERDLLLQEQERQRQNNEYVVSANVVQEVESAPDFFEEEKTAEDKPKTVGKLDFNKITKSFSDEAEEKQRRRAEMEQERRRRENEEREILASEKKRERQASKKSEEIVIEQSTTTEVQSAPVDVTEDQMYEEKRKSVGKLDFNKITKSFGEEAEEKRQRLAELERERIRREKEEKELLLREQKRLDDEYESTRLQNGDLSKEEKRQSVSKLDIDNIVQSFREEDEIKRRRAIELENERRLRDEEEKLNSRELERQRAHKQAATVRASAAQEVESSTPDNDIFFEEKTSSSKSDRERKGSKSDSERKGSKSDERKTSKSDVERKQSAERQSIPSRSTTRYEYEEDGGSSQTKKSVGKLDFSKFTQSIDQEARERERRGKELEIERLRLEREEMEGRAVSQSTVSDRTDARNGGQNEENDESSDFSRPTPRKLDLSKFSAFGGGGLRVSKDDSSVKRRENPQGRQARPKSIAGTTFKGVANGDGYREYHIN